MREKNFLASLMTREVLNKKKVFKTIMRIKRVNLQTWTYVLFMIRRETGLNSMKNFFDYHDLMYFLEDLLIQSTDKGGITRIIAALGELEPIELIKY